MKSNVFLALVTISLLCLIGCASNPSSATGSNNSAAQMDIFRDGNKPSNSYKEIQLLTDDGKAGEQGEIENKMIKKAMKLGGSAIIFYPKESSGNELSGFGIATSYLFKASVIVYTP